MSIYDLAQAPTSLTMSIKSNHAEYQSPLMGGLQVLDRGGQSWVTVLSYNNVSKAKRATIMALIVQLRGAVHKLRVPVWDNPKQGAYGGTPLVDGAAQSGSTIDIKGCSNNITNWITPGDYFGITVNGEVELKMCTVAGSSNGTGLITGLGFEPRLRASPVASAAIIVDDGVLGQPTGVFYMKNNVVGWTSRPFQSTSELSTMSLELSEDLFATQA